MDPLAEKYYSWSPYAYCLNNPMRYMDPLGMDTIPVNDIMNWQTFDTENDVIELNTVTVIPKEEGSSEVEQYIEPIRYYAGGGPGRYPASGRLDGLGMMSPEFIFLSGGRSLYLSSARGAAGATVIKKGLPRSSPIMRGVGAAPRAEMLAKRLKLNINSPTTRQVLNSLDDTVESFISQYRKSSIRSELLGEFLNQTVEQALKSGNTTVRKLLIDSRFVK
jgi:hypothetical protein